jgi:hypothetical protein
MAAECHRQMLFATFFSTRDFYGRKSISMKTFWQQICAIFVVCFIVIGCVTTHPIWHDSGISKTLNADAPLLMAGKTQGIMLDGRSGQTHMPGQYWIERERYFRVTISSGSAYQLLRAYENELHQETANLGGKIANGTFAGDTNEIRGFSYQYNWGGKERIGGWDGGNDGVVGVFSFAGTSNQMQIVLFCYEHKRQAR